MVYPGLGLNYKALQANWNADIAYFNRIGLFNIRPNLAGITPPWAIGTPSPTGLAINQNAYWRLCAQTFANAGFFVTWGMAGTLGTLTSSNYQAYHDTIISEASYIQSLGIILGDFEIGNERELQLTNTIKTLIQTGGTAMATTSSAHGFLNGDTVTIQNASPSGFNGAVVTTYIDTVTFSYSVSSSLPTFATTNGSCFSLTIPQLNTLLRQLALDVKAVYNLGPISYATSNNAIALNDWIANGLGGLDSISIHPYGVINVANQTVAVGGYSQIASMINTFGSSCYISEFNLDSNGLNVAALNPVQSVSSISNFFNTYILGNNVGRYFLYDWVIYANGSIITSNDMPQLYPNGSTNPTWFVFFTSNPTQYSNGARADVTRTSKTRTTVASRSSYPTRPLFNN